jgi:hypothetical protein
MEIEDRIRTQIEAILVNDARNYSEIKQMAEDDEPLDATLPTEERNLYHRIINSYRNAVSEVNKLLEENIGSLSGFYRIVESIKEKEDFQEICSQIVDLILQDFSADYCSLLFPEDNKTLCLEGIREERTFLRIHSKTSLLGSREFERELTLMAEENGDCLKIEDIYKEPRFINIDFPGVVRSVLCLPMFLRNAPVGFLVLSHSLPSYFHDNQVRVLKILGSFIAHLRLLHQGGHILAAAPSQTPSAAEYMEESDSYAVVLMEYDIQDNYGRWIPLNKEAIRDIRIRLQRSLGPRESLLFYGERDLLIIMPGVASASLPARIRVLREAFHRWRTDRLEDHGNTRMNLGFSVCEEDADFSRTLEVATLVMHPESEEGPEPAEAP